MTPIARRLGRAGIGVALAGTSLPFTGIDVWTAYELSWLAVGGKPQVAVAQIEVPAQTPNLIESKSLKLYLGALAQTVWASEAALRARLMADLSAVAGGEVTVRLHLPEAFAVRLGPQSLAGLCLDGLPLQTSTYHVDASLLQLQGDDGDRAVMRERTLHTELFRSNCPVTGQPDFGGVQVRYVGPTIRPASLLAYLISYRLHVGFHEQCVERIFVDLLARCGCASLSVYARFTRRGGLDINPYRTTGKSFAAEIGASRRSWRQ